MKQQVNWHSHLLTLDTVITDNYKTTQNVRRFFKSQLNMEVKFTRDMYSWLHANVGKTLQDAIVEFKARNGIS